MITSPAPTAELLTRRNRLRAQVHEVVIIGPGGALDQEVTPSCGKTLAQALLLTVQKLLAGRPWRMWRLRWRRGMWDVPLVEPCRR